MRAKPSVCGVRGRLIFASLAPSASPTTCIRPHRHRPRRQDQTHALFGAGWWWRWRWWWWRWWWWWRRRRWQWGKCSLLACTVGVSHNACRLRLQPHSLIRWSINLSVRQFVNELVTSSIHWRINLSVSQLVSAWTGSRGLPSLDYFLCAFVAAT
jgi:hypothetical protein